MRGLEVIGRGLGVIGRGLPGSYARGLGVIREDWGGSERTALAWDIDLEFHDSVIFCES